MATYRRTRQAGHTDMVHHPNHYQSSSGLEVKDVIKAFTEDLSGYEAVCTGHIIRYICRWSKKNGLEDVKKAREYCDYLIAELEKEKETDDHENI